MTPQPIEAADALSRWINTVASDIAAFTADVTDLLVRNLGGREKVNQDSLLGLEQLSREFLAGHPFAVGAGAIFSSSVIEKQQGVLEWWARTKPGVIEKLKIELSPGGERFYDYEKLPFFTTAAATGHQTLWGPYMDYLGADAYLLTHTAPFSIGGRFMGVAGCDIGVHELETEFMPILRSIPGDAAVLNASGRVIIGNSGKYLVGERVKLDSPDELRLDLKSPHLGLTLICQK